MRTPNLVRTIVGGFVATLAITFAMYVVSPALLGFPIDIAAMLGTALGIGWAGGMVVHFINGTLIFPLIYAFLLYEWLPGVPAVKGAIWGVVLWLLAQSIVMPMVGAGFFAAQAGGVLAAFLSLLGHLAYGAILGAIAGWAPAWPAARPRTEEAERPYRRAG